MSKVYSHENLALVNTAKGLLEVNGIECYVKNQYHGSGGHVGLDIIPIELWVRDPSDAAAAIALLEKKLSESNSQPEWTCEHCGEVNDGSFEICWKCQQPSAVAVEN